MKIALKEANTMLVDYRDRKVNLWFTKNYKKICQADKKVTKTGKRLKNSSKKEEKPGFPWTMIRVIADLDLSNPGAKLHLNNPQTYAATCGEPPHLEIIIPCKKRLQNLKYKSNLNKNNAQVRSLLSI